MRDLSRIEVLKRSRRLASAVYRLTGSFPRAEVYGLTSQMRRCAVSIAANIAEGFGRGGQGDLERFLRIAAGSAAELDVLIGVATDLGYVMPPVPELDETTVVRKMLHRLVDRVAKARSG